MVRNRDTDGTRRSAAVGRYSRLVRFAKIALPVAAIATVAAIFLVGQRGDMVQSLLTPQEMATLGAGLRLDNPRFAGRTEDGNPFVVRADWALPDSALPDLISLQRPDAEMTLADGRRLTGVARQGVLSRKREVLRLDGDVVIETSDGYRFETERLEVNMAARTARSPVPVEGSGPNGTIEAGSMRLDRGAVGRDAGRIFFEDRVRVVFIPQADR